MQGRKSNNYENRENKSNNYKNRESKFNFTLKTRGKVKNSEKKAPTLNYTRYDYIFSGLSYSTKGFSSMISCLTFLSEMKTNHFKIIEGLKF